MTQPMFQMSSRAMRDAQKWQRWSWKRRLFKRLINPDRAREMAQAYNAMLMFGQPQRRHRPEPAFWHASHYLGKGF